MFRAVALVIGAGAVCFCRHGCTPHEAIANVVVIKLIH